MSGFWARNFDKLSSLIIEDTGRTRFIWFLYIEFHEDINMEPMRLYSRIILVCQVFKLKILTIFMSGFWARNFDKLSSLIIEDTGETRFIRFLYIEFQ